MALIPRNVLIARTDSPAYEFRKFAMATNETYLIAAAAVVRAMLSPELAAHLQGLPGWKELDEHFPQNEHRTGGAAKCLARDPDRGTATRSRCDDGIRRGRGEGTEVTVEGHEEVEEAWSILLPALVYRRQNEELSCGKACPREDAAHEGVLTLQFFRRLVRALDANLAPIVVPSPLVSLCRRLVQAPRDVKEAFHPWLSASIDRAGLIGGTNYSITAEGVVMTHADDACKQESQLVGDDRRRCQGGEESLALSRKSDRDDDRYAMIMERRFCRLDQAASAIQGGVSLFSPLTMVALLPSPCLPEHSCIPNVQVEGRISDGELARDTGRDDRYQALHGESGAADKWTSVRVGLVTLRHVEAGEHLFAPYVRLNQSVHDRHQELTRVMGKSVRCDCPRCHVELGLDSHIKLDRRTWKNLADQALEEGRHTEAWTCYKNAISTTESTPTADLREVVGDAINGIGIALLAAGRFRDACRAWKRGSQVAPWHPALRAQREKEVAYRPIGTVGVEKGITAPGQRAPATPVEKMNYYSETTDGDECDIFMSKEPILSQHECRNVITAAESHAEAIGGWTTSRHYAVPTTDVPVHELSLLLPWFRTLLSGRLFPLLARQFKLRCDGREVAVHDAFVVRYDAGKQRHLPLHRDQATHSFTIALNGLGDYVGGGTFFPSLGRAVRPDQGHVLSFRGDILHGGDPILQGVRYIIACFCYADVDESQRTDREMFEVDARSLEHRISLDPEQVHDTRGLVSGGTSIRAKPKGYTRDGVDGNGSKRNVVVGNSDTASNNHRKKAAIDFGTKEPFAFRFGSD